MNALRATVVTTEARIGASGKRLSLDFVPVFCSYHLAGACIPAMVRWPKSWRPARDGVEQIGRALSAHLPEVLVEPGKRLLHRIIPANIVPRNVIRDELLIFLRRAQKVAHGELR